MCIEVGFLGAVNDEVTEVWTGTNKPAYFLVPCNGQRESGIPHGAHNSCHQITL